MNNASPLEMALLGLLKPKPQSGYDLRKTLTTTGMRHFSDSPGSIYPALRRLEARGWIASSRPDRKEDRDRRQRRDFHVTAAGAEALKGWLELPVTRGDVVWNLKEIMLSFTFMDGNVPRTTILRFLDQFVAELTAHAADSRRTWEQMKAQLKPCISEEPLPTGLLAFESELEGMEAQIVWAKRAREQFRQSLP